MPSLRDGHELDFDVLRHLMADHLPAIAFMLRRPTCQGAPIARVDTASESGSDQRVHQGAHALYVVALEERNDYCVHESRGASRCGDCTAVIMGTKVPGAPAPRHECGP